ncbi:protein of unknown function DUF461 [Thermobaculum terrenum ATCC BAA-798]|uniref:Copper chaperone PCu(A)C n=1 Tax=Thermobaculum terrenum (strain ATCC BAA-798 / CCMEE 7001 / YNP1) TaxID=525904 RepID=D1CES7_THET1|nr:copper chaperone PCu(A)C [Thermobaculum terrenum]ACZ41433.1 protein of unknown function DUF461 [Thermobaculum terrenum ATCC BAA-798]
MQEMHPYESKHWLAKHIKRFAVLGTCLMPLLLLLAGCTTMAQGGPPLTPASEDISVSGAWVRVVPGGTGSAYMTITNNGGAEDALIGVSTDIASSAMIHRTEVKGGVASMTMVDRLPIPAHGKVELSPGGYHIMLEGLRQQLSPGDEVVLRLRFERAGEVMVRAEVRRQ